MYRTIKVTPNALVPGQLRYDDRIEAIGAVRIYQSVSGNTLAIQNMERKIPKKTPWLNVEEVMGTAIDRFFGFRLPSHIVRDFGGKSKGKRMGD